MGNIHIVAIKKLICSAFLLLNIPVSAETINVNGSLTSFLPTLAKTFNNPSLANVEETSLVLEVNPDSGCEIVDTKKSAETKNSLGDLSCVFEWVNVPAGISGKLLSARGIATQSGSSRLSYQISFYSGRNADRIVINSEDIDFNLEIPIQPIITNVSSVWDNNSQDGLVSVNFSSNIRLKEIIVSVESRPYEQIVKISRIGQCSVPATATKCKIMVSGGGFGSEQISTGYSMHNIDVNSVNAFFPSFDEVYTIAWNYQAPEFVDMKARMHTDAVDGNFPAVNILYDSEEIEIQNKQAKIVIESPYSDFFSVENLLTYSADMTNDVWTKKGLEGPEIWLTAVKGINSYGDAKAFRYQQKGMNGKEGSQLSQCVELVTSDVADIFTFGLNIRASMGTNGDQVGIRIDTGCNEGEGELGTEQWFDVTDDWQSIKVSQTLNTTLNNKVAVYIYGNNAMDKDEFLFIANPQLNKGEENTAFIPTLRTAKSIDSAIGTWKVPDEILITFKPSTDYINPDSGLKMGTVNVLTEGSRKTRPRNFSIKSTMEPTIKGQQYIYTIDLTGATNGVFMPTISMKDGYGNESYAIGDAITLDDKGAEIDVYQVGTLLKENEGVYFPEDLVLSANDEFIGGATIDAVQLDGVDIGFDASNINYARLDGSDLSLIVGQHYLLGVTATDKEGNQTFKETTFEYMPTLFDEKSTGDTIYQKVQLHRLQLIQRKGRRCKFNTTKEQAIESSVYGRYSCYGELSSNGTHAIPENAQTPIFEGTFDNVGIEDINYRLILVNPDGVEREMYKGQETVNVIEPVAPSIDLYPKPNVNDELFAVSLTGGDVTSVILSASNGALSMELNSPNLSVKQYDYSQSSVKTHLRIGRKIKASKGTLWESKILSASGWYQFAPDLKVKKDIPVVYVPSKYIRANLERTFRSALNTEKQIDTINLGIYNRNTKSYDYDEVTMGKWKGYLAIREGDGLLIPITAEKPLINGSADFEIDISNLELGSVSYVGVAHLDSEVPGYTREIITTRNYIRVWKGTEIQGGIQASRVFGRVPFTFYGRYNTASADDTKALGAVRWEQTFDDVTWTTLDHGASDKSVRFLYEDAGVSKIRAIATNKFTGVESITQSVEVTAYETPTASIIGPSVIYYGETQTFNLMDRGELADDVTGIIEWSYNRIDWVTGTNSFEHTGLPTEKVINLYARMRYEDTTAAGKYAYDFVNKIISVKPPAAPKIVIKGSMHAEVGKVFTLEAKATPRYSGVYSAIEGSWLLPDGSEVSGDTLTMTVPESWAGQSKPIVYSAWHETLELETKAQKTFFAKGWKYEFPDYTFKIDQKTKFAPSLISISAVKDRVSYPEPIYFETSFIPMSTMTLQYEHLTRARFIANDVGVHTIKIIISDTRGNTQEFIETIDVVKAKEPATSIRTIYSNSKVREPLDVVVYASVNPDHYLDTVAKYEWYLDGVLNSSVTRKGDFDDIYEGDHEIKMIATTAHGHKVERIVNVTVKDNITPTCKLTWRVETIYMQMRSNCVDEDGQLTYWNWEVDGLMTSAHGTSVNYYYPGGIKPTTISVKLTAFDDSNESTVVTEVINL